MAEVSYYSIQTYAHPGGANADFVIPFPYILRSDVVVFIGGVAAPSTDYVWMDDGTIRIIPEVSMGLQTVFRRFTKKDKRWADYHDGATLGEDDLNIVTRQLLYINQELYDYLIAAGSTSPPPGGVGNPGGGGETGPDGLVDQVIAELLASQLFKNLIEAIDLIDINAETIMSAVVNTHTRWGEDRRYDGLIKQLSAGLGAIDARYTEVHEEVVSETAARVTAIEALQSRFNGSEADIINLQETIATNELATAEKISVMQSKIDGNTALIGTINGTYATKTYVETYVQTQMGAAFAPAAFNGYLNASSVIQGIRTKADAERATVEGITSYLVGSGFTRNADGSINWGAPGNGSLAQSLSAVQQTVNLHASQLSTEAQFRQSLASRFSPGNAGNPAALTSAIEQAWKTYADSQSTTASRVTVLESNRQPVFFRASAPNWTAAEFTGGPFATNGFPENSTWYREIQPGFYVPYVWKLVTTAPSGTYSYGNFGPYGSPVKAGMWIEIKNRATVDAVGALATTVESTYVREDEVGAKIENQLQSVLGPNYASINERLDSWINSNGLMYSGWQVRINQTGGSGVPTVAGVGLGMQNDPNNPNAQSVSSFIVMADRFAVVKPPSGTDYINGTVDPSKAIVPFIIDATTGTVGINGKLIVKGTLSAYDGAVGRLVVTQLDGNGNQVDPNGTRLVLPSNQNNWNASPGASPFTGGSNPQRFLIWAGTGTMNHNNAKFYVDTDGNARFDGEVSAKNIVEKFQQITTINWSGAVLCDTTRTVTTFTLPGPLRSSETHTPLVSATLNIQSVSGDNGAMQIAIQRLDSASQQWIEVYTGQLNQGNGFGINHALNAVLPPTNKAETYQFVVRNAQYGHRLKVQGIVGFCMGIR